MTDPAADRETALYWLALHLLPDLGARNALKLIRAFGGPPAVFHASVSELRSAGIRTAVAESIHAGISFDAAADELRKIEAAGARLIFYGHEPYPAMLAEIADPPILLYAMGDSDLLGSPQIGIVGTRRPTQYGRAVAERLSRDLALEGLTITSGMARGIDSKAHVGALEAGGKTIAVLGTGVDVAYPRENTKLRRSIVEQGLALSEFPMGATGFPQNFPIRNRIISGSQLRHSHCRRRPIQRLADYREAGPGAKPRCAGGSGQHFLETELGAESIAQRRRDTGPGSKRRDRRTAS